MIKFQKKKIILISTVIVVSIAAVICCICAFGKYYYAGELIGTINDSDMDRLRELVENKDLDVNTPDIPDFWFNAMFEFSSQTPIAAACRNGNLEAIEFLIENGANIAYSDNCDLSLISLTVMTYHENDIDVLNLLWDKGAYIDDPYVESGYVLIDAATNLPSERLTEGFGYSKEYSTEVAEEITDVVRFLIDHDVKCESEKLNGLLLHQSASFGNFELVKYLCEDLNFDPNLRLETGQTVLFGVDKLDSDKDLEILKYLLDIGADKTKRDYDGKTAYDYALERGENALAEMLKP